MVNDSRSVTSKSRQTADCEYSAVFKVQQLLFVVTVVERWCLHQAFRTEPLPVYDAGSAPSGAFWNHFQQLGCVCVCVGGGGRETETAALTVVFPLLRRISWSGPVKTHRETEN